MSTRADARTLLVNPGYNFAKESIWASVASCMPPLGLAALAAMLEKHEYPVAIKDFQADSGGFDADCAFINEQSYDFLGISATTPQIYAGFEIARAAKHSHPEVVTIFGGVHPTVMPDEVLSSGVCDIVVRGEGESTLLDILSGKPWPAIKGISYKAEDGIVHNPEREPVENLDDLPDPAYHLLPVSKYFPAVGSYKQLPAISIIATRGCPGKCTYCHRQLGKKVRTRSGDRIADEVKRLHDTYGIREIAFYDDTFTVRKKEVYAFTRKLKEYALPITWACFSRVDSVDYPLLKEMADAGCHQILFGVESADREILQNIRKNISMEQVKRAVGDAQKAGIEVRVSLMLGNPGESLESVRTTQRFVKELRPDLVMYNITTPYPGTEMFDWADNNGYLLTKDWSMYDLRHHVMQLPTISNEELSKLYSRCYRDFYLRPEYIFKRLVKLRTKIDIINALRGIRAIFKT
jgi:radical SAM superfamily enzyme YgiQ (UPF0313 family)